MFLGAFRNLLFVTTPLGSADTNPPPPLDPVLDVVLLELEPDSLEEDLCAFDIPAS